jgi:TolB-like protein/DNA-binding winged helix-turn-helix (wHTH) protein/tetratricopeptide (TPR) repeat protein
MKKWYIFLSSLVSGDAFRVKGLMSTSPAQHQRFTFGAFTLDTRRGTLQKKGKDVKIRAQSFQVLAFLLSRHGTLVGKDELHTEIWGNKVVSDDSLTHCLLDIRKCLGDTDKTMVRTVPRRGYIFEAPCLEESLSADGTVSKPKSSKTYIPVVVIAVLIAVGVLLWALRANDGIVAFEAPANSIAVLPFADMSESQDQRYLADGVSDEVLNHLARSPNLRVTARTSSFSFAKTSLDIASIRDVLNVAFVLEGSVRRKQGRLAITAQLVDTATSANVWSDSYEGRPDALASMQKQIVDAVLQAIVPDADESLIAPVQRSFSASELMLLARYYEQEVRERPEVDTELLREAIGLYRDAVEADPFSALAHSRLASALLYAGDLSGAESAVFKANSLDPNLSEVQQTLGEYFWMRGLPGAGVAWKRAIELNPSNADALSAYAYWYWMQANDDGPEELFRLALELDPLSLTRHAALGEFLAQQARVEKTHELIVRIQERFDSAESCRVIARLLELIGEVDSSIAWTIEARNREPENPDHVGALAELYAELGDYDTALLLEPEPGVGLLFKMRRYEEVVEKAEILMIEEPDDIYLRYLLAFAYNVINKPDAAIRILRTVGQPVAQRAETRQPVEVEGFVTFIDALDALGDVQQASELAEWFATKRHTESNNWWVHTYRACAQAIAGHDEDALAGLERLFNSPRLPWATTLRDLKCFGRYRDEPRYVAVLEHTASRRQALRARLPETLRKYGVELQAR